MSEKKKIIITIARQYGSGGADTGKKLAEDLGISFYDKNILRMNSDESGIKESYFHLADEKAGNRLLYKIINTLTPEKGAPSFGSDLISADNLFRFQSEVIRKLAAEEFPQYDVNLRSAVSIARRLQDPLAELVKIDPKSIGVGQYQHDMNQKKLGESLNGVVEDCVNKVGVDLNTASVSLLEYISGISKTIAKNIVDYREENGKFTSRSQLLKVAKLGPKAFEQCAGFMRISDGKNPLDATGVHPESYDATKAVLEKLGYTMEDVKNRNVVGISKKVSDYKELADEAGVGEITLRDIVKELEKPARDPREDMPKPILRSDVLEMKDLTPGMVLKGTVRNVIDFGCFVDIGVHQDGLVHISEICDRYIKHPLEAVSVGDIVDVQVMSVDLKKQRIQLTMKIGQGTDKAGKSEHSGSGKNNVDNKADRSNRNNGGKNSRNDRNSTGSKNNNNRNKKPHYIKGKKNNFFDNIILDN